MSQIGDQFRIGHEMQGLSTDRAVQNFSVIPKGAVVQIEAVHEANRILTVRHRDSLLYIYQNDLRTCGVRTIGTRPEILGGDRAAE